MKRKMEISELIFKIIAYVLLIVFALVCLYPLVYVLAGTFSSSDALTGNAIVLWPLVGSNGSFKLGISMDAFSWAFNYNMFWVSYANTLFITCLL